MTAPSGVAGVILAGGLSRRMGGGDKTLKLLAGKPILQWVVERARPQVAALILNANGDPARFAPYDLPVVADVVEGFAGPLAGILTGMEWVAAHEPDYLWLASFAADAPFLPVDLVARMLNAADDAGAMLACARSGGRTHPVFGLWSVSLRKKLRRALVDEDIRKIDLWTARFPLVEVEFGTVPVDPFFNVNRPEDLEAAERSIRKS